MVAKTRGKKKRSKRTTQKQQYPAGRITTLRTQRGGDDPVIEGIVEDIKTLNKNRIAKLCFY